MLDMQLHLEKLRADADDCALISRCATDARKSELFGRLAEHLSRLAQEVEQAMAEKGQAQERAASFFAVRFQFGWEPLAAKFVIRHHRLRIYSVGVDG